MDKEVAVPLSNLDLERMVPGSQVVLYRDLHRYYDLQELVPTGCTFILFESEPGFGHWCVLFETEYDDRYEFFDPYSSYPDDNLRLIDEEFREESNQDKPYLTKLLIKELSGSGDYININEFALQNKRPDVMTCGRWCVVRYALRHLDPRAFAKKIKSLSKKSGLKPDELVTYLTSPA